MSQIHDRARDFLKKQAGPDPLDPNLRYDIRDADNTVVHTNVYGTEAYDLLKANPGWTVNEQFYQPFRAFPPKGARRTRCDDCGEYKDSTSDAYRMRLCDECKAKRADKKASLRKQAEGTHAGWVIDRSMSTGYMDPSEENLRRVKAYMPSNYTAEAVDGKILVSGTDSAGWTWDGYVVPRLGSGLIFVEETSAVEGSRKTALNPQSGHGESELPTPEIPHEHDDDPMWPWELDEIEEVKQIASKQAGFVVIDRNFMNLSEVMENGDTIWSEDVEDALVFDTAQEAEAHSFSMYDVVPLDYITGKVEPLGTDPDALNVWGQGVTAARGRSWQGFDETGHSFTYNIEQTEWGWMISRTDQMGNYTSLRGGKGPFGEVPAGTVGPFKDFASVESARDAVNYLIKQDRLTTTHDWFDTVASKTAEFNAWDDEDEDEDTITQAYDAGANAARRGDPRVTPYGYGAEAVDLWFQGYDDTADDYVASRTALNPQSGQGESDLDQVEVGDPEDRPMWPFELEGDPSVGADAADVASVPTPGQSVADYPQPTRTGAIEWDEAKKNGATFVRNSQDYPGLALYRNPDGGYSIYFVGDDPQEGRITTVVADDITEDSFEYWADFHAEEMRILVNDARNEFSAKLATITKRTDELQRGDKVKLPGARIRTVERVESAGYETIGNEIAMYVYYQEEDAGDWGHANSANPSSTWEVLDSEESARHDEDQAYLNASDNMRRTMSAGTVLPRPSSTKGQRFMSRLRDGLN